ncbi:hypothetical protein DXG03_004893 [Asterophora parasitica]|uniref:Uncharacterized protein n=1 Tax=Asterophora parasitica TaxID=117018 RepID=A0A9P7GE84_9AGAR|nr:hypothetical protein DXG03_004893 [Asterophora parasitica]
MDNDTAWCPVCDRQIRPKRYQVPVQTTPPPAPPPPSSSPVRRTKTSGTVRQRGGLVQGTGRVKPNGTIRRAPQPAPAPPVKLRTVIDQGPTPLYCSDQCQMADLNRGLPHDFNPERQRPAAPSVSYTADTDSTASSSLGSQSSIESPSGGYRSPSLAHLAAIYNFPPPPPPPPVDDELPPRPYPGPNDYSSGIMMAARRIKSELCAPPQKPNVYGHIITPTERKPIPGWTDGSNAWRTTVYSCAAPTNPTPIPHKSFATRTPRSPSTPRASVSLPNNPSSESDADLLARFSSSFRRTSSNISESKSPAPRRRSSSPSSIATSPQKRERPLLQRGAEGKLLVPQVMLRVNSSASSASLSSQWSARSARSPLSQASSSGDEDDNSTERCDSASSMHRKSKRPTVEARSWSYDNIKTYPIMRLPPKTRIEKRKEMRVVDGEEVEVEVEVEVEIEEKLKRLFLFPAPLPIPPS